MERTIFKMSQDCRPTTTSPSDDPTEFSFSNNFNHGMKEKHESMDGLRRDYEVILETSENNGSSLRSPRNSLSD